MIRTIPIDAQRIALIATGHTEPVLPWVEKDGRRQPGTEQERDDITGQPLWTLHCLAVGGDRPETVAVRLPAPSCPSPEALAPVAFEQLEVRVSVNRSTGQLAGYWSAAGLADVRQREDAAA